MRRELAEVMEQQQSVIVKLRKVPLTAVPCQTNIAKVRLFSWLRPFCPGYAPFKKRAARKAFRWTKIDCGCEIDPDMAAG